MVRMSNWPPLVAISVVTRWRSTFSSSVTHLTLMSGFLAVNWLVRPCMRIMSLLLTVAMVNVVWAKTGTATRTDRTPAKALMRCFTDSSQDCALGICPRFDHMLSPAFRLVKRRPRISARQQSLCSRLVGDQPVDQPSLQGGEDCRHFGRPECRGDG